jgi:Asp-tRNA(Asn)/Glu-tRNA(Gln) amidotransferase A subunit family amidase
MARETSRRDVLKSAAVAAAAMTAASVNAQTRPTTATTNSSTPPETTKPADALTVADVAASDKVAARGYASDAEREMMLESLESYRTRLKRFRATQIDIRTDPAIYFDPHAFTEKKQAAEVLAPTVSISSDRDPDFDGNIESLAFATVADLSRLIKARKITSTQLTRMYLDRLKRFGPRLLCVVNLTEELALKQAQRADAEIAAGKYRGPLHGIPWGAKDLLATKHYPTTCGVAPFKDQVFDFDADVVQLLDAAGAVLVAKLSLGELAMGDVWFGGKTRTPWDSAEGSSGSSAGPAAATAAGLVGFAIGSETLGSIISPCVVNGTTGLRPTFGRVTNRGAVPLTWTMDKLGPICRGVEDCALVLASIADAVNARRAFSWDPDRVEVKSLRIGYDAAAFDFDTDRWKDEELKKLYRASFDTIRAIAGDMKPVRWPATEKYAGLAGTIIAVESSSAFGDLLFDGRIGELVQQHAGAWPNTFRVGATVPAADYLRAMRLRTMLMRETAEAMKDVDVVVTVPYAGPVLAFTNLTGHPSLITRCGELKGRPKMIEFIGALDREDAICRLAFEYEKRAACNKLQPNVDALPAEPPAGK